MAIPFEVLCSQLFFIPIYLALPSISGPPRWWLPHGNIKEISGENIST
uniref:Serine peptidase inhibitor Kazal type 14 (putative) n=1 Tax=Bos mutus grunniens TaxID=30521 RepID=A0A8B9XXZ1_BOSMU